MAKPIECVIELSGREAKSFLRKLDNPPRNERRSETIRQAKEFGATVIKGRL